MTKCPKCQKELEDGFSFCPACGSGITPAVTPPESLVQPDADQVAEQLRILAEKEAEKERKKAERLQRLAEKKVEREQRTAERKALMAQRKQEKAQKLAQSKAERAQKPAQGIASDTAAGAAQKKPLSPTIVWAMIILVIVVAMAATGTAAYFTVKHFWAFSSLVFSGLV